MSRPMADVVVTICPPAEDDEDVAIGLKVVAEANLLDDSYYLLCAAEFLLCVVAQRSKLSFPKAIEKLTDGAYQWNQKLKGGSSG